jgi:hypothetical protein
LKGRLLKTTRILNANRDYYYLPNLKVTGERHDKDLKIDELNKLKLLKRVRPIRRNRSSLILGAIVTLISLTLRNWTPGGLLVNPCVNRAILLSDRVNLAVIGQPYSAMRTWRSARFSLQSRWEECMQPRLNKIFRFRASPLLSLTGLMKISGFAQGKL